MDDNDDLDLNTENDKILKHLENKLKDMKEIMMQNKMQFDEKERLMEDQMNGQQGDSVHVGETWKKIIGDKFIMGINIENKQPA